MVQFVAMGAPQTLCFLRTAAHRWAPWGQGLALHPPRWNCRHSLVPSFIAVATCLPLIDLPNFNGDVLGGTFAGLTGDAAVGAAVFLTGVAGPGADQCASLDVI
jgi:hypothetical protein